MRNLAQEDCQQTFQTWGLSRSTKSVIPRANLLSLNHQRAKKGNSGNLKGGENERANNRLCRVSEARKRPSAVYQKNATKVYRLPSRKRSQSTITRYYGNLEIDLAAKENSFLHQAHFPFTYSTSLLPAPTHSSGECKVRGMSQRRVEEE